MNGFNHKEVHIKVMKLLTSTKRNGSRYAKSSGFRSDLAQSKKKTKQKKKTQNNFL